MAKENYISLKGQLKKEVKYIVDKDTVQIKQAILQLVVMRRDIKNRANDFSPRFDRPIIITNDPRLIRVIQTFTLYDIIEVKGTLKTKHVVKHKQCPHCGQINLIETPLQCITPIYIGKCADLETGVAGVEYLRDCAEISNIAKVIGRVCVKDILTGETERGNKYAKYQIAINRKLFDNTAVDEDDHTDYPVVFSYDNVADEDEAMLCEGALIYLDGYLHTMELEQSILCHDCGHTFPIKVQRLNLTPYSNEYLRDYKEDGLESTHIDTSQEAK